MICPIPLLKSARRAWRPFTSNQDRTECASKITSPSRGDFMVKLKLECSVNIDTLRGQLLYEIQGLYYYNPDVIADITCIDMEQIGKDKVLVSGVKGLPAPETLKVAIMALGGYQAEFSLYITGLKTKEKARSFEEMARRIVDTSKFEVLDFQLYGTPKENPRNQLEATVQLRVFAQSRDAKNLTAGRFLGPMMSNQLQGYPGLTANLDYRTAAPKLITTYFPGLFDRKRMEQVVHFVNQPERTIRVHDDDVIITPRLDLPKQLSAETKDPVPLDRFGPTRRVALGSRVFSRSGDKGANVNVGLFFPAGKDMNQKYDWLRSFLTVQNFRAILADEVSSNVFIDSSGLNSKDLLTRRKSSIIVDLKTADGIRTIRDIIKHVDIVIDPFRPGVLEKLGLGPAELASLNPRLILARMTGFRRDGKYRNMAGHDINYVAVSGVLSMLGPSDGVPSPPMNLLGDFAGGGLVCFLGIVLALLERTTSGRGQVVEANMVDGSAFIATSPRLNMKTSLWNRDRGTNLLDGGCPYYAVYETKDSRYMAVGALEPQFFAILVQKLKPYGLQHPPDREDRSSWPELRNQLAKIFRSQSRAHWESIFDETDACVTPVLTQQELEASRYEQRPIVRLDTSPALPNNIPEHDGYKSSPLRAGHGGVQVLSEWLGWKLGVDFDDTDRGIVGHATKSAKL
ncbi:Isopenicillin N epimerase component 2 [Fusarium proliferatum]|uniref:Isopenicillin N epimerase component 2 n=1 Tax=Gibberella intermedia TaxID=948311 RepID=A0A420SUG5_GIBIN|nr:Isopenicillin N epimerase component 2 [Fusarium proliferatum]